MATVQVPSTALTIQIAEASMVYAGRDISKKAFRPNVINDSLALQLNFASSVLEWTYNNDPSNEYIKLMRNYTLMLCGQYITEAQLNLGDGGIIIDPTTNTPFGFEGYRIDFTIGDAGSPMVAGDQVLTINLPGFIRNTVMFQPAGINLTIGNQAFVNEVTSIVYTQSNVVITIDYPVANGERYIVTGLRYAAATSVPSSGGTTLPTQDGHEGEVLFTDGAGNLYWADTHIDYTSEDFEDDGITVLDERLDHNTFDLFYNEGNRYLTSTGDNPEFTRIEGGGYVINILGWDANVNDYHLYAELKGYNS